MKWSQKAWDAIQPIYKKTLELPFINELMNGTLDREKFVFYIQQDALYLSEYGRTLTGIASKLSKTDHVNTFIHFASDSIAVENSLHESFIKELGKIEDLQASPSCLLYTSYLLRQLNGSIEVAVAAILPCFWIYKAVGDYILENQTKESNPYQNWINTYGGEEFALGVKQAIDICDELAEKCTKEQQQEMLNAFIMCAKLEYIFWDSAYKKEQWCI